MSILIYDYLTTGEENARSAKQLSRIIGDHPRKITLEINRERNELLLPIGATTDGGYFRMSTEEARQHYCRVLEHRIMEQTKTLEAVRMCDLATETEDSTFPPAEQPTTAVFSARGYRSTT